MAVEYLDEIQAATHEILSNVPRDSLSEPTPCSEWDLAALINHLVDAQRLFATLVGATSTQSGDSEAALGDFVATFDGIAADVRAALAAPGFASRTFELPFGTFTGEQFINLVCIETIVHAWDVARATSRPTDVAPASCAHLHGVATAMMGGSPRDPNPRFAADKPAPADATEADRLAAYLGRSVD